MVEENPVKKHIINVTAMEESFITLKK